MQIFLVSVAGLFLEMLLIRWIGSEIHLFAYVQNIILVACFLGLGLGCLTCRQPVELRRALLSLLVLLGFLAAPTMRFVLGGLSDDLSELGQLVIFRSEAKIEAALFVREAFALAMTWILLVLIVDAFVPLGRLLGRLLQEDAHALRGYSLNVAGSLAGVWLFVGLSALSLPPPAWFAVLAMLLAVLASRIGQAGPLNLAALAGIVVLSFVANWNPGSVETTWSPYQKLVVREMAPGPGDFGPEYDVTVNSAGYQQLLNLDPRRIEMQGERFDPEQRGLSQYDLPLLFHPDPRRYLVVGAGTGNDVAGGLRNGARQITAVEIDPSILDIGRRLHPERPYDSPAVRIVTDDARSYFARSHERFDVITFGLLDSHTTTSMTNARLDHYVYTLESLAQARSLLAEHGIMVLTFNQQRVFVADRIGRALTEVFGRPPLMALIPANHFGGGGFMFVAGDIEAVQRQVARQPRLEAWMAKLESGTPNALPGTTPVARDDWPYLYLPSKDIPPLYYLLGVMMLLILARSGAHWQATAALGRWGRSHWHFAFLGAAFLLLEVQNISKASVVLGNTWQTSAAAMSGVLVMALLSNLITLRFPRLPIAAAYGALLATALALYFVDLAQFAFLPYGAKVLVVGTLTALPMLFSGIVFARAFTSAPQRDEALGANIAGAVVGALLQSISFVAGIKALLLVVAGLYVLAWTTRARIAPCTS